MMAHSITKRAKWPLLAWSLLVALVVVVAGANVHLVFVAVASQPECVAHLREAGTQAGEYRAAKSAC